MFHIDDYDKVIDFIKSETDFTKPKLSCPEELIIKKVFNTDCIIIYSGYYFQILRVNDTNIFSFTLQLSSVLVKDMHNNYKYLKKNINLNSESNKIESKSNYIISTVYTIFQIPINECSNKLIDNNNNNNDELTLNLNHHLTNKMIYALNDLDAFQSNIYCGPSIPGFTKITNLIPENYPNDSFETLLNMVKDSIDKKKNYIITDHNPDKSDMRRSYNKLDQNHLIIKTFVTVLKKLINKEDIYTQFVSLKTENSGRQYPHVDHKKLFLLTEDSQLNRQDRDLIFFFAMQNNTKIHVKSKLGYGYETINLNRGDAALLTADYIHAGDGYKGINYRISAKIGIGRVKFDKNINTTDNLYLNQKDQFHCKIDGLYEELLNKDVIMKNIQVYAEQWELYKSYLLKLEIENQI